MTAPGALGRTHTVVIVLAGGRAHDRGAARSSRLANLRMIPLARAVHRATPDPGVAVWRLRYRYRGWNEPDNDPVTDVAWALDQMSRQHPDAVAVLIGHSMGGRAALFSAGDRRVIGVCALAPWIEPGDPVEQLAGRTLLIAHGDLDRITDPAQSRRFAMRAHRFAASVNMVNIEGDAHAMLRCWRLWHALAAGFVAALVAKVAREV